MAAGDLLIFYFQMSNSKKFSSIVVLFVAFITGLFTFIAVLNKDLIARDPAAVNGRIFDLRSSNPDQLKQEVSNRMKIQTIVESNNFVSKAMLFSGLTAQICKSHEKIELEFLADGVSVAGEPTKLIVKTPCQSGQNPLEVGSIKFPIQEILSEKPRSAEFQFSGYPGSYQFINVAESWPRTWVLGAVRFISATAATQSISIEMISAENTSAVPHVLEF